MTSTWHELPESHLVAAIMANPSALDDVAGEFNAEHIAHGAIRRIYQAAVKLWMKGDTPTALDIIGACDERDQPVAEELLALPELGAHAIKRAEQVTEEHQRRTLAHLADDIAAGAKDRSLTPAEVAEGAAASLHAMTKTNEREFVTVGEGAASFYRDLQERCKGTVDTGIMTPLPTLNKYIGGFEKSLYYIVGARPSVGKSVLGMQFARHAADTGYRALFCNLESSKEALIRRLVSAASGVSTMRMRMGLVRDQEWPAITAAAATLEQLGDSITIWDAPAATPAAVRAECMRMDRAGGLDILFIDYVQLMRSGMRMNSRHLEIEYVSAELKALAKQMRIPVVAMAQLGRSVMQGDGSRMREPHMSDLKESGSLEQDADVVLLPHRETVVDEEAKLIIGKQKDGPVGQFDMRLDRKSVRFEE